jgi:hypothetical protein
MNGELEFGSNGLLSCDLSSQYKVLDRERITNATEQLYGIGQ